MAAQQEFLPDRKLVTSEKGKWPIYQFCGITLWFDPKLGAVSLLELARSDRSQSEGFAELTTRFNYSSIFTPERYLVIFDRDGVPRLVIVAGFRNCGSITIPTLDKEAPYGLKYKEVRQTPETHIVARRFDTTKHDAGLYVIGNNLHEFQDDGTPDRTSVGLDLNYTIPRGPWNIPGGVQIRSLGGKKIGIKAIAHKCS